MTPEKMSALQLRLKKFADDVQLACLLIFPREDYAEQRAALRARLPNESDRVIERMLTPHQALQGEALQARVAEVAGDFMQAGKLQFGAALHIEAVGVICEPGVVLELVKRIPEILAVTTEPTGRKARASTPAP